MPTLYRCRTPTHLLCARGKGPRAVAILATLTVLLALPAAASGSEVAMAWYDDDQGAHAEAAYQIIALSPTPPDRFHEIVSCTEIEGCPEFAHPAFSSDGRSIVFSEIPNAAGSSSPRSELVLARADGSGAKDILPSAGNLEEPSFMPDGRHLLYVAAGPARSGVIPPEGHLVSADLDGSNPRILSSLTGANPVASPNGHWVLFEHAGAIWEVTANGSGLARRLVRNASEPAVAPDGRSIAFVVGAQQTLALAQRDGSHPRPLLRRRAHGRPIPIRGAQFPAFSPDGTHIAFGDSDFGATGNESGDPYLYEIPVRGGALSTLWTTNTDAGGTPLGTAWGR